MTYQELIDNIRDLGFSDDDEMAEFGDLVPNDINRAITEINLSGFPIISRYDFVIQDSDTGYLYISMPDIDDMFMDFDKTPVLIEKDGTEMYQVFADYTIEANDTVVINADENKGKFRICYVTDHKAFAGADEELAEDLPLPRKTHFLVPLLASYYIWLEDEPAKAAQYYNAYELGLKELKEQSAQNKFRIRVLPGGM